MKRTANCVILSMFLALTVIVLQFIGSVYTYEDVLSEKEINTIRDEYNYVIYNDSTSQTFSDVTTFRERITYTDTFVYGEVIKEPYKEEYIISSGDEEFDKLFYGGVINIPMLDIYTVRVIEDTEGLFAEGTVLTYSYSLMTQNNRPKPEMGDKIILPFTVMSDDVSDCISGIYGYYYVTEEGYGISAFKEEIGCIYSGKKVGEIIKLLRKTDAENKIYLDRNKQNYELSKGKDGFDSLDTLKEQIKEKLEAKKNAEK